MTHRRISCLMVAPESKFNWEQDPSLITASGFLFHPVVVSFKDPQSSFSSFNLHALIGWHIYSTAFIILTEMPLSHFPP